MEDWQIIEWRTLDNGNVVTLAYEYEPWESPREWSNLGTLIHWHPRYELGDERIDERITNIEVAERYYFGSNGESLYVYMLDHSGLYLSTSPSPAYGGWDTPLVGLIGVTREKIIAEYGDDSPESRERARSVLRGEIATFDQYLRGEVYCWTLEDSEGNVLESVGGYYDLDQARDDALTEADAL
jgi:hypothetical protein